MFLSICIAPNVDKIPSCTEIISGEWVLAFVLSNDPKGLILSERRG